MSGKQESLWKFYFEDGQLDQEINYKDGIFNGVCKWYYVNGQLKVEGNY